MTDLFQIIRTENSKDIIAKSVGLDLSILDTSGNSLLHEAVAYKKTDYAIWLIENGIDLNVQNDKGMSVLHLLPFYPDVKIAHKIFSRNPSIALKDNFGNVPLWHAVFNSKGNYKLLKEYLKVKPNIRLKNNSEKSPLDFAEKIKDEELINLLLKSKKK